jgi:SAM-dependent methyltransferase
MRLGKHLDIGCGGKYRNPYGYKDKYGVDLYIPSKLPEDVAFKKANLTLEDIPFEDGFFDSISAFDFIEHVPRVIIGDTGTTRFPFIDLMNEVWRVLKPQGIFYAVTPAYPSVEAFQDPTHVNIITDKTHDYFVGNRPYAANYGFKGKFEVVNTYWVHTRNTKTAGWTFRKTLRSLYLQLCLKPKTHVIWELRALK